MPLSKLLHHRAPRVATSVTLAAAWLVALPASAEPRTDGVVAPATSGVTAATSSPVPPEAPPPKADHPAAPGGDVRRHDGLYLRLGTGFGVIDESLESENSARYGGRVRGRATGVATLSEFAVGGTIATGFVLGGGVYSAQLIVATYRNDEDSAGSPPRELDPARRNFSLVGPFADWYFDEHRGFHAQLALGLATLSAVQLDTSPVDDDPYDAVGAGMMLGVGYEWWVGDEWSLGVLGRLTGAILSGEDEAGVRWTHAFGSSPSALFTVTYH